MIRKIIIAIDGSPPSVSAADAGYDLARQLNAKVALLHVIDPGSESNPDLILIQEHLMHQLRARGERLLHDVRSRFPDAVDVETLLIVGEPAEMIVATAHDCAADMIIMGSDSKGRLAHFLLGSTADAVIRRAPCPVLTIRLQPQPALEQTAQDTSGRSMM